MGFVKLKPQSYPRRMWALVGYPGSGKSTFAAQMRAPLLVVDADQRFGEVAGLAAGDVFTVGEGFDNTDPERIAGALRSNIEGSGVQTIVIDSLTAILAPIVSEAIMDNDAGRNKNRMAAWKPKALAVRLLQDSVTACGVDSLWIYHLQDGRDEKGTASTRATVSTTELARLQRSLNMRLEIVQDGQGRRGVIVAWARRGRSGMTLWDESGHWAGMPERIEAAVYAGLSQAEQEAIEQATPESFHGPDDAIAWGFEQGCFRDAVHAGNAYQKCKREAQPKSAQEMWAAWVADVRRRQRENEAAGEVLE